MDEKALLEAIGQMMDKKLKPLQEEFRRMQKDIEKLQAGQKNIIKRLVKIEAVQEYLMEDDLEQRDPV